MKAEILQAVRIPFALETLMTHNQPLLPLKPGFEDTVTKHQKCQ